MLADALLALFDIAAIVAVAWAGGIVAQRLRQPRITGEMTAVFVAALLVGGQIADVVPGQQADGRIAALFPDTALTLVTVIGGAGLVLYLLLVGITIDPTPLRDRAGAIALQATASAGAMLALALVAGPLLVEAGGWKPAGVADGAFVLAVAAALAAVGLPIVARILEDREMTHGTVGSIAIVAGTGATALAILAAAVAIGGGDVPAGERAVARMGVGLVLLALVLAVARRRPFALSTPVTVAAVVMLAGGAALAGDQLVSSLILGPLVVGIAVNQGGGTAIALERRLGVAVRRVGLPVFLGLAALHTDLRELHGGVLVPIVALVGAVIALKFAAAYAAARAAGFGSADARAIGALMQCGGVMTIAVSLDVLDAHLIGARMHATFTLIGLVTTIAAGPLLPRARAFVRASAARTWADARGSDGRR